MLSQKYIMATYRFKGNMEVIVRVYMDVRKYQNEVLKVEPPRRGYLRPDPSIRYKMMGNFRRIMKALSGDQSVWNAVETTEEISPLIPEVCYTDFIRAITNLKNYIRIVVPLETSSRDWVLQVRSLFRGMARSPLAY
jgi:hypothetical protein